MISLIKS